MTLTELKEGYVRVCALTRVCVRPRPPTDGLVCLPACLLVVLACWRWNGLFFMSLIKIVQKEERDGIAIMKWNEIEIKHSINLFYLTACPGVQGHSGLLKLIPAFTVWRRLGQVAGLLQEQQQTQTTHIHTYGQIPFYLICTLAEKIPRRCGENIQTPHWKAVRPGIKPATILVLTTLPQSPNLKANDII